MNHCRNCRFWKDRVDYPSKKMVCLSQCTRITLNSGCSTADPFIDAQGWRDGEEKPPLFDEPFNKTPYLHTPYWFGCSLFEEQNK